MKKMKGPGLLNHLFLIASTGLGLGLLPFAPGTFGTLLGVVLHILVYFIVSPEAFLPVMVLVFLFTCFVSNISASWAIIYWERSDPKHFVLDEVAGYLLIPIFFSHGVWWQVALWGFVFFRFFDIFKMPPASTIDSQLSGGWGILLDDLAASIQTILLMYLLQWISRILGLENWLLARV